MNFQEYREPMVGGGSLFLNLVVNYKDVKYVINDKNFDLYCFWYYLKNEPDKLYREILLNKKNSLDGKLLYNYYHRDIEWYDFDRAVRFYLLNRITYSGTVDSGGYSNESFYKRFTEAKINNLKSISNLLKNVEIKNSEYQEIINEKGDDVLIYLDPPYLNNKNSKLYGINGDLHKNFNHDEFFELIKKCNHKWIITINNSKDIKDQFSDKNKYNIYPLEVQYSMDNTKKHSPKKCNELIITNYLPFKLTEIVYL